MKKILFLVTQSELGGAQRYVFEVVSHLNSEKYEILVAAGSPSQILQDKTWKGKGNEELLQKIKSQKPEVRIFPLKYLKRTPWPWQIISAIGEIYNLLKREKPDVLFLCSTTAGLLGSLAAFFYKKLKIVNCKLKIIYRIGGWSFRDPRSFWQNKILFLAEKITCSLKDKIIVNCEVDRQIAVRHKVCPAEKIVKIYNGIDVNRLDFLPREVAREQLLKLFPKPYTLTPKIIGTVANFYKTKGFPYLIEAAKIISINPQNPYKSAFLIIGDGKERKKLESLIKKYNLGNQVFLLGQVPDAYKYLRAFDLFVLPSIKEGFPWVILEAMVAEVPILATKVGAIPEIIEDKKEGILVEPKNPQVLAEKIIWLLNNQVESKQMGIRAKEKLKEFTLEKMIEETEKIINNY